VKRWVQRLCVAVILTLATLTGAALQASPAHANRCFYDSGWVLSNNKLSVWANRQCINPETVTGMDVLLERFDPTLGGVWGAWVIVAKTKCGYVHMCNSTHATKWRFNGDELGLLACS